MTQLPTSSSTPSPEAKPTTNLPEPPASGNKKPVSFWVSLFLLAVIAVAGWLFLQWQQANTPKKVEVLTREGVVTKIQSLNRLQTVAYNVDTVITSQKEGNWYALWQDEQKGLFVAHGRVTAGIDLNQLKPTDVQVTPDGSHVSITLPAAQILDSYLDNIEVYDIQTGVFGMVQADPQIFNQAQEAGKNQVLTSACRSGILQTANDNAQKQVQSLFALANVPVTVKVTAPAKNCR